MRSAGRGVDFQETGIHAPIFKDSDYEGKMTPKERHSEQLSSLSSRDMYTALFPGHLQLIPGMSDLYELELAFLESKLLTDDEVIRRGAYFARVGGCPTYHAQICSGETLRLPNFSSARLRSFFESKQFKTSYATHGLFPYRGKFHPQMVKALINIMGLKPGDTILDPMMGSGTVLIEASLMGIKSVGVDVSPFCQFMAQAKLAALKMPLDPVRNALKNCKSVFSYFQKLVGTPEPGSLVPQQCSNSFFHEPPSDYLHEPEVAPGPSASSASKLTGNFLKLAYLDSAGYTARSTRNTPYEHFRAVLQRYLSAVEKIQNVLAGLDLELAPGNPLSGDARHLPIQDSSIDGILFSPPYSFAVDYLKNDSFHLESMGVDLKNLREKMVGLRGRDSRMRFELYKTDMGEVLSECARVLRPGGVCSIVVGTNDSQIGKMLGVHPSAVPGIDELLVQMSESCGFRSLLKLSRQIIGIANTMRTEYILMLMLE
ncbi:MAG: TRM11 family SAM-dependent methyltransferase [Syntrophobacteraceae bacterium]